MDKKKPLAEIILIGWEDPEEWKKYFFKNYLEPIENQFSIKSGTTFQIKIYRIVKLMGLNFVPPQMEACLISSFIESAVKPKN